MKADIYKLFFTIIPFLYFSSRSNDDPVPTPESPRAVLVYMENPGENFYAWHQLPLTLYPSDQYSATLETVYYDFKVTVYWTNSDLRAHENPCDFYNSDMEFKVVLIDAVLYSKYQNEDLSNYETVKQLFNITTEEKIFQNTSEALR